MTGIGLDLYLLTDFANKTSDMECIKLHGIWHGIREEGSKTNHYGDTMSNFAKVQPCKIVEARTTQGQCQTPRSYFFMTVCPAWPMVDLK